MVRFYILSTLIFILMIACNNPSVNSYIGRWKAIGNEKNRFTIRRNEPVQPNTATITGEPRFMLVFDNKSKTSIPLEFFSNANVMLGTSGNMVVSCEYITKENLLKFKVQKNRTEIYVMFQRIR